MYTAPPDNAKFNPLLPHQHPRQQQRGESNGQAPQQHPGRALSSHLCSLRTPLVAPAITPAAATARPLKRQLHQTPGKVEPFPERQRFPCSLECHLYGPVAENDLRFRLG